MQNQRVSGWIITLRIIFTLFSIGIIFFIFSNSAQIGQVSSGKSQGVLQWLNQWLSSSGFSMRLTEHQVRKAAHFLEYALLGFLLTLTLRVYTRKVIRHITVPCFLGLLTAAADETFQAFVPGRGSSLFDVWIDFAGSMAGIILGLMLLLLVFFLFPHSHRQKLAS